MARPARFPSKAAGLLAAAVLSIGCGRKHSPGMAFVNLSDKNIHLVNGIYLYNTQPFSGCVFALDAAGSDTLFTGIYRDGKEDGEQRKYYDGGQLIEKRYFENGRKTGLHEGYWPGGKTRFRYHFKDDLYDGVQYKWHENGHLYTQKYYRLGQEEGMQQEWDTAGNLKINYQALNGRQYGNIGKKNCASMWADSIYSKPRSLPDPALVRTGTRSTESTVLQ